MHSYDPDRLSPPGSIPSMRPARDLTAGPSPTPIYDTLYAEYRRAFRALPGDRTGEEHLSFQSFGTGTEFPDLWAGRHDPLPEVTHQQGGRQGGFGAPDTRRRGRHRTPATAPWQAVGRLPEATGRVPAALPPAPRREN